MKHKHHIVPKHMGGNDSPENLIELSIEEHAIAHKELWEKYGQREDFLAWQGLAGLMTKEELVKEMLSLAGRKGALKSNLKQHGTTSKFDGVPYWKRFSDYPVGVDGRKVRTKKYWFNNDVKEGQFSLNDFPKGWKRGRLKSVMKKTNPNVRL